ncbi:PqqD family peptide modification chaperone [Sphingomonas faeni]|uniref:PqqD family peptide modification chaperone n=1 Tax=Sphingomonas faeni TaxID=185950 RepID=UPI003353DB2E
MIIRKQGDWLAARVGDEILMMSAEQGLYLGLNAVGARIWDLIETPSTADTVCARLLTEFAVEPDLCRVEVDAFLVQLARHRAIVLEPPTRG